MPSGAPAGVVKGEVEPDGGVLPAVPEGALPFPPASEASSGATFALLFLLGLFFVILFFMRS